MSKAADYFKAAIKPAANIIFGFCGLVVGTLAVAKAKAWGVQVPDDMAYALPGAIAVAMAHGWDVVTGDGKSTNTATGDVKK